MYNLAIRIQSGGKRPRHVHLLHHLLAVGASRIRTIYGNTLWDSCRDVLRSGRTGETHLLVLQDDILPCADLVATAEVLIRRVPNDPITLFTPSPVVAQSVAVGNSWAQLTAWFMAQAYILPVPLALDIVEWVDKNVRESVVHDDDRMATYMWYHRRKVWATCPSLVEHLGWNYTTLSTYKKTMKFEPRLRMASRFIGFENSGLDVDWRAGIEKPLIDSSGCNSMFCSNVIDEKAAVV